MTLTQNEIEVLKDAIECYQDAICGGCVPHATDETMDIFCRYTRKIINLNPA